MNARAVLRSTTGTAPITFTRTPAGVRIDLEDGSTQVYAAVDVADAALKVTLLDREDTAAPVAPKAHPGWGDVPVAEFADATRGRPWLLALLDNEMGRDPREVAAALRELAAVLDGGAA